MIAKLESRFKVDGDNTSITLLINYSAGTYKILDNYVRWPTTLRCIDNAIRFAKCELNNEKFEEPKSEEYFCTFTKE